MPSCDSPIDAGVVVKRCPTSASDGEARWWPPWSCVASSVWPLLGLQSALHRVPDFYAQAIAMPAATQQAAGEALERNVLALHNEVRDGGQWSAVFTDEQINGWLAADLPEKFPHALAAGHARPARGVPARPIADRLPLRG